MANRFKLIFLTGYDIEDIIENGNIDANILLENGNVYAATFITPLNLLHLMDHSDILSKKNHIYLSDMIIVRDLRLSNMKEALLSLLEWDKLGLACEKIAVKSFDQAEIEYKTFDIFDSDDI